MQMKQRNLKLLWFRIQWACSVAVLFLGATLVNIETSYAAVGGDRIVINEVMFMPETGPEWVELYNASGEPRDADQVWFFDASDTINPWKDLTVAANDFDDEFIPLGAMTSGDVLYLGRVDATFQSLSVALGANANAMPAVIQVEYWNGSSWQDLIATDGTESAGIPFSQNGDISWTVPSDWVATQVNGISSYYVRLSVDATLSASVDVEVVDYSGGRDVDIVGYDVANATDNTYTIPAALPPVPVGAFVVILYDGLGSAADDYDFSDGLAELHTSTLSGDVLTDVDDRVTVYTGVPHDELMRLDFVAWGDNPEHANFINTSQGRGSSRRQPAVGRTIGLYPRAYNEPRPVWAVFFPVDISRGAPNPIPTSLLATPWEGADFAEGNISFAWITPAFNVVGYRFQLDDGPSFGSPLIDEELAPALFELSTPLGPGTYYWRVQTIDRSGERGAWSLGFPFSISLPSAAPPASAKKDLNLTAVLKTKDTKLVCLECRRDHGRHAWDNVHKNRANTFSPHSRNYCYAGCIKMLSDFYRGSLSMDRIAYQIGLGREGTAENAKGPEGDLRHSLTAGDSQIVDGLSWALGDADISYKFTKPTFAQVKGWVVAGKPFILGVPGHVVVIDGYTEPDIVHYNDPDTGRETKPRWGTVPGDAYWVLKPATAAGRMDEGTIKEDTDEDGRPRFVASKWDGKDYNSWGLMTFDEKKRFKTDPIKADTDNDCVQDKVEVWSYVFGGAGRKADQDGDNIRAELDSDTDDGGELDGAEDTNLDGDKDGGETDPFVAADDGAGVTVEYFFQGTSPPVPGIGGTGESWATMDLSKDDKKFRFRSADNILGQIDTQTLVTASRWNQLGSNPERIVFTGNGGGAFFYVNVLLEDYLRAVVDVIKDGKRVRYLLMACKP
jgi:hypothetical protein